MNEAMAVAISPQLPVAFNTTHTYMARPNTLEVTDSQNSRKRPVGQQQFGRYQSDNTSKDMGDKTPSSISLEALVALLESNSVDDPFIEGDLSPPVRSEGYSSFRLGNEHFSKKSQSFPKVNRSPLKSSLHTSQKPKVRRSRSVRFADTQGFPLEKVKRLTSADPFETEGEIVPSLTNDLGAVSLTREIKPCTTKEPSTSLPKSHTRHFKFPQPGTQPDFYERLQAQKVCLESIKLETRAVHGIVRTLNLNYEKRILVRWTHDRWKTHHDSVCAYCDGSSDGYTDRFSFTIPANGDDIEFAISYQTLGQEYWDNNRNQNYLITVEQ